MKKIVFIVLSLTLAVAAVKCKKTPEIPDVTNKKGLPTVTTDSIKNVNAISALCYSNVVNDSNLTVMARGVCWNTTGNPTLENSLGHTTDGTGTGSFTSQITGLTENTTYYVAAYASNEKGTSYGSAITFITLVLTLPTVTTSEISNITVTSATGGGNVTSNGNGTETARGVCWNTTGTPTLENSIGHTDDGTGTGNFTSQINGLTENTTYYVTAYAKNEKGATYGQEKSFVATNDFIDPRDGQRYKTIVIGSQTWMSENLNYETADSWWYNNSSANGDVYGRLYTWDASLTACPSGWHLPSDDEWKILAMELGMTQSEADATGWRGTHNEGGQLKETSTMHWYSPNTGATNSSGFTALPGGYYDGAFGSLGSSGYWWSSSEHSGTNAWGRDMTYDGGQVGRYDSYKTNGFSVRCLKN